MTKGARIALQIALLLVAFALGAVVTGGGSEDHAGHAHDAAEGAVWTCSMHPSIRQSEPGTCPICGMDLIEATSGGASDAQRVVLSDRARALAKLRTTTVRRQADAAAEIRLLGRIEPDETTGRTVTTWIGGRIERLHVNTTGERIRQGQVIATLYSPEVYGAHQDLITAQRQVERLANSPVAARDASEAALRAARERLRLLGVPDAQIDAMAKAEAPTRTMAIRSPFAGTVIERAASEGAYVTTGAPLYRLADLRTVWVQLDAYESDLPHLAVGQAVALVVEGMPDATFEGQVSFIDPTVDRQRRTARVRVAVANPDGRLRPGMFAQAVVAAGGEPDALSPLVVPASAPLFTGRRSIVYVEVGTADGVAYEPRTVRLGPRMGELYPVVSGLTDGERVVTRGAFTLDADLQIRGGPSMMTAPPDPGTASEIVALTAAQRAELAPVVRAYLDVQTALADDDHAAAVTAAARLEGEVVTVSLDGAPAAAWAPLADSLRSHARHVHLSSDLQRAREGIEPLSHAVETLLRRFGNPLDEAVSVAFCPMAKGSDGARWVQRGDTVNNAYFGASMLRCGEIVERVAGGTYLAEPPAGTRAP